MEDTRVKLSTLWVVVMLNMVFADVLGFMVPGALDKLRTGYAEEVQITPELLLVFAMVLEIPIAMVLLSRVLKYRANRWANIVAGAVTIAFVVGGGSLTEPHYLFLAAAEIICVLLIVWYVWKWPNPEAHILG